MLQSYVSVGDYRREVLRALVNHPAAKTSSLAKAFCAAFDGLEVTSSIESEYLYIKYNAIADSEVDTNSSGSSSDGLDKDTYLNIGGNSSVSTKPSNVPKLKPSPFSDGVRRSSDDDDDLFTPSKSSRGEDNQTCENKINFLDLLFLTSDNENHNNMDKTFMSPPTLPAASAASTASGTKSLGASVASLTSAAKGGIMNWWYGGSTAAEPADNSDPDNDLVVVQHEDEQKKKSFSFYVIGHREVVLYCCACFVSTMPGYMYLTPTLLCLAARIPGK